MIAISATTPCPTCGVQTIVRLEWRVIQGVMTQVWHCLRCDADFSPE